MKHRRRRKAQRCGFDARPGFSQVGDILGQFGVAGFLRIGPQNEAAAEVGIESLKTLPQLFALPLRYFLRHTNMVVLRQENQQPAGNTDLTGQSRALGTHRVLEHLHHQRLTLKKLSFDRLNRRQHGRSDQGARCGRSRIVFRMAAVDGGDQVRHVQEGRTVKADIDERRLHARQYAHDLAEIDVSDQAALQRAFHVQFLHRTVFHHGHARFLRRPVDEDVLLHID